MAHLYTDSDWDIQDATSSGSVLYEREQSGGWKRVASNRLLFYVPARPAALVAQGSASSGARTFQPRRLLEIQQETVRPGARVVLRLQVGLVLPLDLGQLHEERAEFRVGDALGHETVVALRVTLALECLFQGMAQVEIDEVGGQIDGHRQRRGRRLADLLAIPALHLRAMDQLTVRKLQQPFADLGAAGALGQLLIIDTRLDFGLNRLTQNFLDRRLERLHRSRYCVSPPRNTSGFGGASSSNGALRSCWPMPVPPAVPCLSISP